jgi:hypothetical protein
MPTTYAIPDGRTVMAATLYTGTGASLAVSNTVNGTSFQPDWVWIKSRSNAYNNELYDVLRGVQKRLISNLTNAESTSTTALTAFNSNGFTQGGQTETGANGATYVAWQWKANGAGVTNTAGTITSTVSANTTAGFSVATYTGNGSAGATFGHGLGVAPSFVIVKERGNANGWLCYHISTGNTGYLELDATLSFQTLSTFLNNTTPSSSVVTLGTVSNVNRNGGTFVAYCFAPVAGYSAFGSYTGNGSTDGPFVYLGFRPRWVMFKNTTTGAGWLIFDSSRNTYNLTDLYLQANQANAEAGNSTDNPLDFLSNGFKLRYSNSATNASAEVYIYMAFAENPFKNALAR